jgi:hypothetical protein
LSIFLFVHPEHNRSCAASGPVNQQADFRSFSAKHTSQKSLNSPMRPLHTVHPEHKKPPHPLKQMQWRKGFTHRRYGHKGDE